MGATGSTVMPYGPRAYYQGGAGTSATSYGSGNGGGGGRYSDPLLGQLNQLWNLGQLAGAPQNKAIDQNLAQQMQQLGLVGANLQTQTGLINQGAGISGQRLDLNQQGLGIQQNALARALGYLPQEQALTNQGLAASRAQNMFQAGQQQTNLRENATVGGNLQSVGTRRGFGDIATQLGFQQAAVDRQQKGSDLGYQQQRDSLADQGKQLGIAAKSLGLDRQELTNRTQSALQQLGLSSALNTSDIIKSMNDLNAGRFNPIQNILPYIYQLVGVRPTG